jgi:hypothetical protein
VPEPDAPENRSAFGPGSNVNHCDAVVSHEYLDAVPFNSTVFDRESITNVSPAASVPVNDNDRPCTECSTSGATTGPVIVIVYGVS